MRYWKSLFTVAPSVRELLGGATVMGKLCNE